MNWLIGKTGYSFLDYWTLVHLSFWFFIGSTLAALKLTWFFVLPAALGVAFSWEIFERFAERQWPNIWLSPESWWNSYLSDPMTCVIAMSVAFYGYAKWRPK